MGGGSFIKDGPPQQEGSRSPNQVEDDGEEQESLRRAKDDATKLRATVERLEIELNSVKAGGAAMGGVGGTLAVGDAGFGLGGGNGGVRFGAAAAAPPWMPGGMAGGMGRGLCFSFLRGWFIDRMQEACCALPCDIR